MTDDNAGLVASTNRQRLAADEENKKAGAGSLPTHPLPQNVSPPLPYISVPLVLCGQSALVICANSGIGCAVALTLARTGADVVVNFVTEALDAEVVAEGIHKGYQRALAIHADDSCQDEVKAMRAQAIAEPDDIRQAAGWLASDMSDYVTRTSQYVDGGLTLFLGFSRGG